MKGEKRQAMTITPMFLVGQALTNEHPDRVIKLGIDIIHQCLPVLAELLALGANPTASFVDGISILELAAISGNDEYC